MQLDDDLPWYRLLIDWPSIANKVRSLFQDEGPYLLPRNSVPPDKLSSHSAAENDAIINVNGTAQWGAPSDDLRVLKSGDTMTGDLTIANAGDATLTIAADTDNAGGEDHNPTLLMTQDGGAVSAKLGIGDTNLMYLEPWGSAPQVYYKSPSSGLYYEMWHDANAPDVPDRMDTSEGSWRDIAQAQGRITGGLVSGNRVFAAGGGDVFASGGSMLTVPFIRLDPADYGTVPGKTLKIRMVAVCAVNDTAPGVSFGMRLYPVTLPSGGAGALVATMGAFAVANPPFLTPAANSITEAEGTADDFPAAGIYALGVSNSGATAASSMTHFTVRLQYAWE